MSENETKLIIPGLGGIYAMLDKYADLILRIIVGGLLIPHGMQKLFGAFGGNIDGTIGFLSKFGLNPALPFAYYIGFLEFFGGIFLVIGLFTRLVSIQVVGFMLVAAFYVHINIGGFFWVKLGFEYPLMWATAALYFVIKGGGRYSVDHKIGKEF